MLLQPSGILPVWVEDGDFHPLSFTESAEAKDWVPNIVLPGMEGTEDVRAGRAQFYRHKNNDRVHAQCFYMLGDSESLLWRIWFADPDGRGSDFEWFVRFGGKWWWVPLREYRGDAESPHIIRFQVKAEGVAHAGLLRRAKAVYLFIRNRNNRILYREVFTNPGLA